MMPYNHNYSIYIISNWSNLLKSSTQLYLESHFIPIFCLIFLFIRQEFLWEEIFWNCLLGCWMMTRVILLALQFARSISLLLFLAVLIVDVLFALLMVFLLAWETYLFVFSSQLTSFIELLMTSWSCDSDRLKKRQASS